MFDWIRFVVLGKILLDMKTEESIRTAISRFYYGIFGVLRRYLINVKHKYVLMSRGGMFMKVFFVNFLNLKI